MGYCRPLYGDESSVELMNKISKIDEKINALLIEREKYVEAFKESIKKQDSSESED